MHPGRPGNLMTHEPKGSQRKPEIMAKKAAKKKAPTKKAAPKKKAAPRKKAATGKKRSPT